MGRSAKDLMETLKKFEEEQGKSFEYFSLQNDKDTAVVRFLYDSLEELDWYVVHEVQINGKKRWLKCTEDETCPQCRAGQKPKLKVFLQLEDDRDPGVLKIWERGQNFIPKIVGLLERYGSLIDRKVEVERNGKAGDKKTKYNLYPLDAEEDFDIDDLTVERIELCGENGFILEKSIEDMELILNGSYSIQQQNENYASNEYHNSDARENSLPKRRNRSDIEVF